MGTVVRLAQGSRWRPTPLMRLLPLGVLTALAALSACSSGWSPALSSADSSGASQYADSRPITAAVTVDPSRRVLSTTTHGAGCQSAFLTALEGARSVRLVLHVTTHSIDGVCQADDRLLTARVRLKASLETRAVSDALTGAPLAVR